MVFLPKRNAMLIGFLLAVTVNSAHGAGLTAPKGVTSPVPLQVRNTSASRQAPAAIPLADVATQATEVAAYLGSTSALIGYDPKVQEVVSQFPQLTALIDREMPEALRIVQEQPSLAKLQQIGENWQARQRQLTQWLTVLTARANQLQGALDRIDLLQKIWLLTHDAAQAANAPPQIILQTSDLLEALKNAKPPLDYRRSSVLVIQDAIARQLARCGTVLSGLDKAQQNAVGNIMSQDTLPLWSGDLRVQAAAQLRNRIASYGEGVRTDLLMFVGKPPQGFMFQCGLFFVVWGLLAYMRRRSRQLAGTGQLPPALGALEFPLYAAMAVSLYYGATPWLPYPQSIRLLMQVLAILPMVWLSRPAVSRRLITLWYVLAMVFTLDAIRQGLAGTPLLEQVMLLTEAVIGMVVLRGALTDDFVPPFEAGYTGVARHRLRKGFARLALPALAIGIGATVFGYLRLARLLVSTVLGGGILALALFTSVLVMTGIVAFLLRNWPLNVLRMVSRHSELLERRTNAILVWVALFSWLIRVLDYVGLFNPALQFAKTALTARLERGAFSISLGDIIAFVLTVWLAYLIAAFISFVLNEDIFPRTRTSQGVSYAVSSLLRYLIIVIGFMAGLGVLGVTLDRVIILISALGVGIGFGLQTVVNNFISGLILLFERPVHVGDTVEFGAIYGEVRRIGIRSSKVHTWQGADIIVPNSQLVTESVTNWTLSDQLRRIDLPLGVNYGADPRQVIAVLQEVAQKNPRILASPVCVCLFTGFGDSTINFELRAWTEDFSNWYQIRSELAVAAYDAVRAAGMSFAFPQREVRLLKDDEPEPALPVKTDSQPADAGG